MINVFIGYDKNEKVAFNVLSYSILKHSTRLLDYNDYLSD